MNVFTKFYCLWGMPVEEVWDFSLDLFELGVDCRFVEYLK